ncbi:hypothetical protein [Pseudoduganella chitinolytica]|uniref:Uncharacterized protein n=1 Tax=Pseudoduganella chitinolytica TaxID=34070 RepID=A0ABY8BDV0_9BURK|nr:hypothetical protein [Pseudoduganella chitinolytica]WEF34094.1 hypothetical protein PX653_04795 [Pseudoduganella chitinolytica]
MTHDLIEAFIEKWLDFQLQIRQKDGFNEPLFEELVKLLQQIKPLLERKDSIPKSLAEIFLDMWGAMTSCAEMYGIDVQQRIYVAADHLTNHARDICTS